MERSKLENLVFKHTHKDYKSKNNFGFPCILRFNGMCGTTSVPLATMSEAELIERLPAKVRKENGL